MDVGWLQDKQVAFTGRLASMTRSEAANLVRECGGKFVSAVNRQTSLLVVGQEGLPLTRRGHLTRRLEKARALDGTGLHGSLEILAEEDFFARLGLASSSGEVHRRYSMSQLCRLLRLPGSQLRRWVRMELVKPVESQSGVCFFDFQQVTSVKTLWELTRAGITPGQIRRSLEQLRNWLPAGVEEPLSVLSIIERDGRLLVRLQEGQLADPSGQIYLDFSKGLPAEVVGVMEAQPGRTADQWWDQGHDLETAGDLKGALESYRQALLAGGPNARLCFNLGNVLYALGRPGEAAERFRQAIELDSASPEAWNNLGNTLCELNQHAAALAAYRLGLKHAPGYADLHYNLADALDRLGRFDEARSHWQAYLSQVPAGPPGADYARHRLKAALSGSK